MRKLFLYKPYLLLPLYLLPLFFSLCGGMCQATDTKTESSSLRQLKQYQQQVFSLQGDIAVQQGLKNGENARTREILAELEILDRQLLKQQKLLKKAVTDTTIKKEAVALHKKELALLQEKRDTTAARLEKRSAALYKMGKIGLINAAFSRKSMADLLSLKDAFTTLLQHDQKLLSGYQKTLEAEKRTQLLLKRETAALTTLVAQTREKEQQLLVAKEKKSSALAEVCKQKELRKQAIQELRNASKKLTTSIARIKADIIQQYKKFQQNKGNLPMPVSGGLVATKFQQITTNTFGEKYRCNGIEIKSPDNADVIAIGVGKVYFANYLQGFGNTIIINHGMHYYSIVSRLEEIIVKEGARVQAGEKIAIAGESATLFSKGVYFEIRKRQQQLDPLTWIAPQQIKFVQ